ncbi:MAG TPA: DNA mismatch repair endonuclease MutL [Thermotogaceae bacterium]|nr:DNA mismatch repair endonuclease MutL [Thermotogaceae bacterium]
MRIIELPADVVKRIAAGEVVVRPVSVVKELIENSIDAGAKTVTLYIENGGKSLIEVIDDGVGMERDEILLAIKPHTTSKIKDVSDLYSLSTYGFRGEALASIVNVSETSIISKTSNQAIGSEVIVRGGEVLKVNDISCNTGTTIRVRNLFFNIPARRRFLSSANIEARMITELFQKFMLSLPQTHLVLIKDGEQIYNAIPTSDILERILIIFPELRADHFIKIDAEDNGMRVSGYMTRLGIGLKNRIGQIFFVNGRYVRVSQLYKSFEVAVGSSASLHPYCIMYLKIPSDMIDVNVHPQKLEVKFSKYQKLQELIVRAVRKGLSSSISHKITVQKPLRSSSMGVESSRTADEKEIRTSSVFGEPRKSGSSSFVYERDKFRKVSKVSESSLFVGNESKEEASQEYLRISNLRIIGVLGERYIICQQADKLIFVDQHAAHERILYEDLKSKSEELLKPQILAFPIELKLDQLRLDILREKKEFLKKLGFEIDPKHDKAVIKTLPTILPSSKLEETLREIISELRIAEFVDESKVLDSIYAKLACASAVKTSDKLQLQDIYELIKKLLDRKLLTCPHGRPLMLEISEKDLDRWFKRS